MSNKSIKIIIKEGSRRARKPQEELLQEKFIPDFIRNIFSKESSVRTREPLRSNALPFDSVTTIKDSLERLMVHHFGDGDHQLVIDSLASELRRSFGARRFLNLYTQEYSDRGIPTNGLDFDWNPVPNGKDPEEVSRVGSDGEKEIIMTAENAREFAEDTKRHLNDALATSFAELLSDEFDKADDAFIFELAALAPNKFLRIAKQKFPDKDEGLLASWGTKMPDNPDDVEGEEGEGSEDGKNKGDGVDPTDPEGDLPRPEDIERETTPDEKLDGSSSKFAVPVFKKFSGEEQAQGAPARSLASQLMKLFPNIPKEVLMNVLKGVAKQLKGNNIKIQENKDLFVQTLVEQLLLEKKPSRAERAKNNEKLAKAKSSKTPIVVQMDSGAWTAQNADGEQKKFHQLGYKNNLKAAKKAAQDWANGVQTVDQAGAEIEVDDKDVVGTIEKPKAPGQALKDTAYVALFNHLLKVQKSVDMGEPAGLDAAMRVDQAYLGIFRFYRGIQYLLRFLSNPKTANALDDDQAGRIIKMIPILKKLKPLNEEMISQDAKEMAKMNQRSTPLDGPIESYKEKLHRLAKNLRDVIVRAMLRYPPHNNDLKTAIERAQKILSDTRKERAGVKDPKDPGYSPADTEIQQGSINVKQLVGPQLKAADLFDPAKDKQNMRVAKSQAARLKAQGKDKEARTVLAKAKQKAGGAVLQRDITKVIRRFLNKQMQRIGADMSIVAENKELFETALIEELRNRGLIK